ncbi:MAG: hypothetical protein KatS3mg132_052 [Limisphaera sp.]|nr:MAG: hypothetical protein KatS3mg132_052 [Limisphaera sp.]
MGDWAGTDTAHKPSSPATTPATPPRGKPVDAFISALELPWLTDRPFMLAAFSTHNPWGAYSCFAKKAT